MRVAVLASFMALVTCIAVPLLRAQKNQDGDYAALLERLRKDNPGEYEKVRLLAEKDRAAALEFLRNRYAGKGDKLPASKPPVETAEKTPAPGVPKKTAVNVDPMPARRERFTVIETLPVGEFFIDLCRRADGAFGLAEIRHGKTPLRRADFLMTWQVDGKFPGFQQRDGATIVLSEPKARLRISAVDRTSAGMKFTGLRLQFEAESNSLVETASWEPGGSTKGLSYFDGYRGWHAPPGWVQADAVPPTNPKLLPSALQGTGFQFLHGDKGALLTFHTHHGDRLRNASRGQALEFVTSFNGPPTIDRYVFVSSSDSRANLWTRAFEVAHAEQRKAWGIPERSREIVLQWPPFSRKGFRETARECAEVTAREGFTAASIDVIWDNADFHGGAKNMNVWDYSICDGYGGEAGLHFLIDECKKRELKVFAWVPAGHLAAASPVWRNHPEWILKNDRDENFKNPSGLLHGALDSGFRDYFRDRTVDTVKNFKLDGLWIDTHLPYAQQTRPTDHAVRLASIYRDFIKAGAKQLLVEGDASALGAYAIAIDDDWEKEWGKVPDPELYYGALLNGGSMEPRFYLDHFRRYVAAGAPWVINWDFLFSPKLTGPDFDAARREIRQVLRDYRAVKDRMDHRFTHADGSGYTWTNDRDAAKIVWLLKDAMLPDGRRGEAGKVYVIEK